MEKMTRNEAAAFLGVDPQTITNWVKRGFLGGFNDKDSKRFYVNADDVHKFSEKYKLMAVSEKSLDEAIKKLKEEGKQMNASLENLMKSIIDLSSFKTDEIDSLIQHFIDMVLVPQSHRCAYILRKFILGCKIRDIAYNLGLTESRVRALLNMALRILINKMKGIQKLMEENASLQNTIALKEKEIVKIKDELVLRLGQVQVGKDSRKEEYYEVPEIFKKKVTDFNLPVRTLNCLRYADINTIGDLVSWKQEDLLGIPNMGKKSIWCIEELLTENGLRLDMPIASVYTSGMKTMQDDTDLIQQKVSDVINYFQMKYNLNAEEARKMAFDGLRKQIEKS